MISPAQLAVFRSGAQTVIGAAWIKKLPLMFDELATTVPSNTTQEVHAWTGKLPKMRLWNGSRVVFGHALQTYTLINQPFESTLEIDQFELDDAHFGEYWRDLGDMAEQSRWQYDYMFINLLENSGDQTGSRQNGLDGGAAFSAAHPVDLYNAAAGTYVNDFTGGVAVTYPTASGGTTSITVGGAFSPTAVFTLVGYMRTINGEDGVPLGVNPDTCMFHPILQGEAELILRSSFFAPPSWGTITAQVGAADNPINRYGLKMLINPLLTQAYTWYVADTSRGFRPFMKQVHTAPQMVPRVNPNDPIVFDQHKVQYGQWLRGAVGWGPAFEVARSGP